MVSEPKICLIGAGGMSFGPAMVLDAINNPKLRGATMMLHDINLAKLNVVYNAANRLNARLGNPIEILKSLDPAEAMTGANFCLTSTEVGRFRYWRQDYEVPNRHGATQINGENGGPGAVFHSLRSIKTVLGVCADIARYCPDTFLINLTNPMSRVTLAINTATKIRNVGLCHEFAGGVSRLALLLRIPKSKIVAKASGINHFTFFTEIRHADTGEDLYPRVRRLYEGKYFQYPPAVIATAKQLLKVPVLKWIVEQMHTPLVAYVFREFGLLPCSVDSHIGEYLAFGQKEARYHPAPWHHHEKLCATIDKVVTSYGSGRSPLPFHRIKGTGEEAFPIMAGLWTGEAQSLNAVNVPNRGYIPNLPEGAIVEVPATTGSDRIEPQAMPPIIAPLAELMKTQITLQDLIVKAAVSRDPALAYEALRMDPCSPKDDASCRRLFDELMTLQADALPF